LQLLQLLTGKIKKYFNNDELFESSYKKEIIKSAFINRLGIEQDEQADKRYHGGEDKALLCYGASNYEKFKNELDLKLEFGSFGENMVIDGLDEHSVNVGDRYRIGELLVEVTQPRQPCWKIDFFNKPHKLLKEVVKSDRVGWYVRILNESSVKAGDEIELVKKGSSISIYTLSNLLKKPNRELAKKVLTIEALATSYKRDLERKLKL